MNAMLLERAEKWLGELGIKTQRVDSMLFVNRTDMMNAIYGAAESQYNEILYELKKGLNSPRLFWTGRDDEWLWLESY